MPLRKIDEREKTDVGRSTDLRRRKKKLGPAGGTARNPKKPVKPQPSPRTAPPPRRLKSEGQSFNKNSGLTKQGERRVKSRMTGGDYTDVLFPNVYLTGGQAKLDKNNNNKIDAQDFKILKAEKAKGRGMGLQDEKMKPGKVMKARRGDFIKRRMMLAGKSDGDTSFDAKKKAQDMGMIDKKTGKGRDKFMKAAKSVKLGARLLLPVAAGVATVQYLKKKMKDKKDKPKKKMGGGMMQRPMQYKAGTMIKARGGGIARSKPTKMY
jgi:hypothetical protein